MVSLTQPLQLRCSILFVCAGPTRSGSCILRCSMRWCFCLTCAILYSIFEIFWVLPGKMIGFQSVTMCKTHSFARNQPTDPASVAWLPQGPERVAQCWPTSTNPCDWSRPVGDPKRTNPVQQTAQWDAIPHYSTKPNAKHQTRQKPKTRGHIDDDLAFSRSGQCKNRCHSATSKYFHTSNLESCRTLHLFRVLAKCSLCRKHATRSNRTIPGADW